MHTGSSEKLDSSLTELTSRIRERRESANEQEGIAQTWFTLRHSWTAFGIAASIAILIGLGFGIRHLVLQRNQQIMMVETTSLSKENQADWTRLQYLPPPIPDEDLSQGAREEPIFTMVEELPMFLGGDEALTTFLSENISCQITDDKTGKPENVFVNFIIEEDGSVSNVRLVSGTGDGCVDEVIRGIESMPNWIPGKMGGRAVRVSYILLLKFS